MAGEISEAPVTKIDGGPQLNTDAYHYDSQPAVKAAVSGTQDSSRATTDTVVSVPPVAPVKVSNPVGAPTPVRTEIQATVRTNAQTPVVVTRLDQQTGSGGISPRVGNCNSINYGDSGSSPHAYDSWTPGSDRSHATQGSLAQQWWQASDQAPTTIQTDQQNLYSVQFGDSLSAIAKRELTTEGKAVTKENLKAEEDLIVSLNDCHYQSLDNNRGAIMAGWKLLLKNDATPPPSANVQPENLTVPQSGTSVDYMHHYTAIALLNPQSHFHFTPSQGPNAQKDIDLLATGQLQRGDVVLYQQPGQLARVVYLGPNDHRPPNKQINPDGTIGPVTDPAFINWTNNPQRQTGQPEQQQIVPPQGAPQFAGYRRRHQGTQPVENITPPPIAQPQPLAPVQEHPAYNGPIPHYTAVPFTAGNQILFSPAAGKSAGGRIDVAALDQADLQATDVLLVRDGALASVYYMNGHIDSRPPNKQIKDDGTVGGITDQEFTAWSQSYYGSKVIADKHPSPLTQNDRVRVIQMSLPENQPLRINNLDLLATGKLQRGDVLLYRESRAVARVIHLGPIDNTPPNKEFNPLDGSIGPVTDPDFVAQARTSQTETPPPIARGAQPAAGEVIPPAAKVLPTINQLPTPIAKPQPAAKAPTGDNQAPVLQSSTIDAP